LNVKEASPNVKASCEPRLTVKPPVSPPVLVAAIAVVLTAPSASGVPPPLMTTGAPHVLVDVDQVRIEMAGTVPPLARS
jgi:hypothetical protein